MRTDRALTVSPSMLCTGGMPGLGGCLVLGACVPGPGGLPGPRGVPGPGGVWSRGCLVPGGVPGPRGCLIPGGGIPACTEAEPSVNRITDACENITTFVHFYTDIDRLM